MKYRVIRLPVSQSGETERMLNAVLLIDRRKIGPELAWLIERRHAELFGQPSPVTIQEAEDAAGR